ncbi:MAG TPA: porin family protein [Gemmatimonadales bacterium]|jgi:hypothetical protein
MRKFFPAVLGAMIIAVPLHAQANVGLLGGFVSSSVTASNGALSVTPSSRSGFAVGITATGKVAPHIAIGPDVMYIEKGFKVSSGGESATFKLNYVEVPLLVHVALGRGPTKVFLLGGPALSLKASCNEEGSEAGVGSASESCEDAGDNVKSTDFSLMFGGGVGFGQIAVSRQV